MLCYCTDCQAFARHFGRTDMLDGHGGSDLYQVQPHQVVFLEGEENLAVLRLTGRGPLRWYAACCGTPMANTWTSPKVPFATLTAAQFNDRDSLGPIHAQTFRRDGLGYVEKEGTGIALVLFAFLRRVMSRRIERLRVITPRSSRTADEFSMTSIFDPSLRSSCNSAFLILPFSMN